MKVIVASKNPVKIEATRIGFQKMFPEQEFEVIGISAPSDVNDQPMSEEETYLGAKNRAYNAQKLFPDADFWVGLEAGLDIFENEMYTHARIVILGKNTAGIEKLGHSHTGKLFLPKKLSELVQQGMELGDADDIVFKKQNSKQSNGALGILTKDNITRTEGLSKGVICALAPFVHPDLY